LLGTDRSTVAGLALYSGLLGHSHEDAALVDEWIHFAETEVASMTDMIKYLVAEELTSYNKAVYTFLLPIFPCSIESPSDPHHAG
jgi:hypothetical protein